MSIGRFDIDGAWVPSPGTATIAVENPATEEVNGGQGLQYPFGSYKQSGNGRGWGSYGLDEFLEIKSLNLGGR